MVNPVDRDAMQLVRYLFLGHILQPQSTI